MKNGWWELEYPFEMEEPIKRMMGIPKNYSRNYIENVTPMNPEQKEIIDSMQEMFMQKTGLLLMVICGGNGTGKTYLGSAFINSIGRWSATIETRKGKELDNYGREMEVEKVIYHDYNPRYVNEADLLNRIGGYGKDRDWFGEYTDDCEVLVIDELGMAKWEPRDKRRIEQLLNKRYSNGFKTILMTNLDIGQVFEIFGSQLQSRLRTGKCLSLTGPDLRHAYNEARDDSWLYK